MMEGMAVPWEPLFYLATALVVGGLIAATLLASRRR
jgi:hypothetical protein